MKKSLGLSMITLLLLLGCSQEASLTNPVSFVSFPQSAIVQAEDLDTPLHKAVLEGDMSAIPTLLLSIPSHTPGNQGNTPLHLAVLQGHVAILKLLLTTQPEVNTKNEDGKTPLYLAVEQMCLKIFQASIKDAPLSKAMQNRWVEAV